MSISKSSIAQRFGDFFDSEYDSIDSDLVSEYNLQRPGGAKPLICSAPFASMRFNRSGDATPCCQNYGLSTERYPDKSIKEIWFGDKYQRLRKHMRHNDLSLSCGFCKTHIVNKNFSSTLAPSFDYLLINENKFPSYMDFSIDNTCNLECTMCNGSLSSSIRKNRDKLPALVNPYDLEFVKQLEEFIPHLQGANFSGGESFLIDLYYNIWDKMMVLNPQIQITITTNGTVLNKKIKDVLSRGRFNLTISTESLQKKNYEQIRVNGKYEKVKENIAYFHKYCQNKNTLLSIAVCPIRQNWKELPDFVNFCNNIGATLFFNIVTKPVHQALWSLDALHLKEVYDYLKGFKFPIDTAKKKANAAVFRTLLLRVKTWYADAIHREQVGMDDYALDLKKKSKQIVIEKITNYIGLEQSRNGDKEKLESLISKMNLVLEELPDRYYTENFVNKIFELPMEAIVKEIEDQGIDTLLDHMSSLSYYSFKD